MEASSPPFFWEGRETDPSQTFSPFWTTGCAAAAGAAASPPMGRLCFSLEGAYRN